MLKAGFRAITALSGICAKKLPKWFSPHGIIFFRPRGIFFGDRSGKFESHPSLPTRNKNKTRAAAGALRFRRHYSRAGPFNVHSLNASVRPTAETDFKCPKIGSALREVLHRPSLVQYLIIWNMLCFREKKYVQGGFSSNQHFIKTLKYLSH